MTRATEIIVNRNAKRLQRGALLGRIDAAARGRARLWETRTLDELAQAARAIARAAPERVALCGGDGTFMAGLSALHHAFEGAELPDLALIPAGTVATVARNWGARDPLAALERVLDRSSPEVTLRSTLSVAADDQHRLGFTFGTGLVAHFFEAYDRAPRRGLLAAASIATRVFAGSFVGTRYARRVLAPVTGELSADGKPFDGRAFSLVVCSVLRDLGLHLRVTYRAGTDRERVHLVAASLAPRHLGLQARHVLRGRPLTGPGVFDELVREFSFAFDGDQPGPYVLDGDTFTARRLLIRCGPQIRVIA